MHHLDSAALDQLGRDLDQLEPAAALELLAHVRAWTTHSAADQMARARAHGLSWRSIALASGTNPSTVRRWAAWGAPDAPRRRVGSL